MEYSIGAFAKLTGLGVHTLRYYEQEGLLTPARNPANRRRYSQRDAAWVDFIKRLKSTGMPIREIRRYAWLRAAGNTTLEQRLEMLLRHREELDNRIRELEQHRTALDEKILFYRQEILRLSMK